MRAYHRSTLVKNEAWPLVDGWYWCPESVLESRVAVEKERLKGVLSNYAIQLGFSSWKKDQERLGARLAHHCRDGKIRAPSGYGIQYYQGPGGIARLYGKCRHCDEALSDGVKCIILMEKAL